MFFTKVRKKIEKIYEDYSKDKIEMGEFDALLEEDATLEELYQKMEDFKDFGEKCMRMYNEITHDQLFISSLKAVERRGDIRCIEVMMTFCNDKMHKLTPLNDHWIHAFDCGPEPDVLQEMFTHLHKGLPHGREMLAEYFYWKLYSDTEDVLKETVLYARKDAFLELWEELGKYLESSKPYEQEFSTRNDHLFRTTHEERMAEYEKEKTDYEMRMGIYTSLKDHYLKNYMRTVPCAAS